MISDVFIKRPRMAIVIALVITIAGLISIKVIPVSQYPDIAPPTVQVSATYSGADTLTVEQTVALPIESQVNGVSGMRYMRSNSNNSGQYSLQVMFELGVDPDIATVDVQNQVKLAEPRLPQEVISQGLTIQKQSTDILQVIAFYSDDPNDDQTYLSNFLTINVIDELKRINGVGDVFNFGARDYAMRVWLDPKKLADLNLEPGDVINAVQSQHLQAALGRVGAQPTTKEHPMLQMTLTTKGRLSSAAEFEDIIIRALPDGSFVRIKDIGEVELGAANYDVTGRLDGKPTAPIAIYLSPGANAVSVAQAVADRLDELKQRFPAKVKYTYIYNTADFVMAMIDKVVHTLIEAFVLVGIVVFVFLGRVRPTLIPLIAVPVSIIGSVAVLLAFGYSANTISLLAMVLAIGIVVDDAIIVVENVEKVMEEEPHLTPQEATSKAMGQITAPIIAITLVLLSVFVPVAFLSGTSGVLFRQFAVTIAAAMCISALNALTLSPALCAVLLRPGQPVSFMRKISEGINSVSRGYGAIVKRLARFAVLSLALVAGFGFTTERFAAITPSGFLPTEDIGYFIAVMNLPPGASLNRSTEVMEQGREIMAKDPAVDTIAAISGFDLLTQGFASNAGVAFVRLKDYSLRLDPSMRSTAVVDRLSKQLQVIGDATFLAVNPPSLPGIGTTGGFEMMVEALEGQSPEDMAAAMRGVIVQANQEKDLGAVYSTFNASTPQLKLDIDRSKLYTLGLTLPDVFTSIQGTLAGVYTADITLFGKGYTVWVQGAADSRMDIKSIYDIQIRNSSGEMVPLSAIATAHMEAAPQALVRYNNYRAISVNGSGAPGIGDGQAIASMEDVAAKTLPSGFAYEWTGQALELKDAAGQTAIVLGFAFLFAYLFLVALYESWNVPIGVLSSVSAAIMVAVIGIWYVGAAIDVYAQIGVVVLIALAAKNAILIVEFALDRLSEGHTIIEAASMGAQERFRPVMMTSFAFIAGLVPLIRATGPGADSMFAVGIPVFFGMLGSSVLGVFVIPLLFVVFEQMREWAGRLGKKKDGGKGGAQPGAGDPPKAPAESA